MDEGRVLEGSGEFSVPEPMGTLLVGQLLGGFGRSFSHGYILTFYYIRRAYNQGIC